MAELARAPPPRDRPRQWTADELYTAIEPYWEEHESIGSQHEARSPDLFVLEDVAVAGEGGGGGGGWAGAAGALGRGGEVDADGAGATTSGSGSDGEVGSRNCNAKPVVVDEVI